MDVARTGESRIISEIRRQLHFPSVPNDLIEAILSQPTRSPMKIMEVWEPWIGATHEAGHAVLAIEEGLNLHWVDLAPWSVRVDWPGARSDCFTMLAAGAASTALCVEDCGYPQLAQEIARASAAGDIAHMIAAYKGKVKKYAPRFFERVDTLTAELRADSKLRLRIDSVAKALLEAHRDGVTRVPRSCLKL